MSGNYQFEVKAAITTEAWADCLLEGLRVLNLSTERYVSLEDYAEAVDVTLKAAQSRSDKDALKDAFARFLGTGAD